MLLPFAKVFIVTSFPIRYYIYKNIMLHKAAPHFYPKAAKLFVDSSFPPCFLKKEI